MKPVLEVLEDLNAKPGDVVTDGVHKWTVVSYADRSWRGPNSPKVFLRGTNKESPIVAGGSLNIVVIPGLRREPKKVAIHRYLFQHEGRSLPEVSLNYYPSKEAAENVLGHEAHIVWITRIDETAKEIEVPA